jgi:hypothetical protein
MKQSLDKTMLIYFADLWSVCLLVLLCDGVLLGGSRHKDTLACNKNSP